MKKSLFVFAACAVIFAGAFLLRQSMRHPQPGEANPRRSGAMEALEFWTASRAYPADDIPADKYFRAWSSKRLTKQVPKELASGATWEPIGPTNLQGRSLAVAINPQNTNTVYLGTASGGLWRSYGGGLGGDWEMVDLGYPALGIGAVVIDPGDTNVMYLGTGEVYRYLGATGGLIVRTTRGSYGIGILKSTDGGTTWSKSLDWTYQQQRGIQAMKLNPLNSATIWAATTEGMYKSTNAGASWTNSWPVVMATDLVIHSGDTNRIIGAFGNLSSPSGGVYRTTDGGSSWLPMGAIPAYSGKTQLHMYETNPDIVYASVCDSVTGVGATWRTTDFGDSWAMMSDYTTNGIYGVQGWYSHYVAVHPTDSSQVFTASVGASKSTDGGITFSGTSGLYSDNHGFAIDPVNPNVIFSANDDGIYRSSNFGQSFTNVGAGMQTGQLYKGLAASTTDSNVALVQSQDHIPGYLYSGALDWTQSAVDEAGWTAIDPSNDDIQFAINRFGGALYRSTDGGGSFFFMTGFGGTGAWNTPVVISPANPLIMFVGKSNIFRSINGGVSFTDISGVLDGGNPALCLGMPATTPDTLYAGMSPLTNATGVYRWVNGSGWTEITGTLPNRYPMDIRVDPTDAATVYIAMGGFGTGHLYKSTNAGGSWTDITGTLPDVPTTSIAIDPLDRDIVYVGNDISVYVSTNGGTSWSGFGEGLPDGVIVSDLTISPSDRSIMVGTHGNGVYERKMLNELPGGYFDYKSYAVTSPAAGGVYNAGAAISPLRASFRNNGAVAGSDSFDVRLRILQGVTEVYSATVTTSLLGVAEIRQITFPGDFTPADSGNYTVQAITLEADDDGGNDTLETSFTAVLAPTIQTYLLSKTYCPYTEIVGGIAGPAGDDVQMTVTLPFLFTFDGYDYDKVQISTNGWVEFGTGVNGTERGLSTGGQLGCCGANQNGIMGSTARPTKAIGGWWEDLNTDPPGASVRYITTGLTPDRVFTVQWKGVRAYYDAGATTTLINFQVKLYEGSNAFDISYGPVTAGTFGGSDIGAMTGMKDYLGGDYRYLDFATGLTGPAGDVTTTLSPLTDWPGPDSCYHVEPAGGVLQVGLDAGWNLISRPLETADSTVSGVFPSVISGSTWAFEQDAGYFHAETLEAGRGYWSKFPSSTTQQVSGDPLDSAVIVVDTGWNIIGSVDHAVPAPSGGLVTGSVWEYDQGYSAASVITPGKGYWVKSTGAGPITLGPVASPKASRPPFAEFSRLGIADAAGGRQNLYLASAAGDYAAFALPPPPPGDGFDARFPGDRAAAHIEESTGGEIPIRLQGAVYPLELSFARGSGGGDDYTLVVYAGGGVAATYPLEGGERIVVPGSREVSIAIRMGTVSELPAEFALGQNYPNPFNPSTRISFDVPSAARVVLSLYNTLGEQVAIIADGDYAAGRHAVDAYLAGLPTGVYVCRMQAGSFSASRKMMLMK